MNFLNRVDAGRRLAKKLGAYARRNDVLVLGIPRGGVPVAFQVAAELEAPLDVFVVRKLGVPGHEELAFGAIATGGIRVVDSQIVEEAGISDLEIELIAAKERQELDRRERLYRGARPPLNLKGKTVILVDDGIATGASTRAAILALRQLKPASIVLAAPNRSRFDLQASPAPKSTISFAWIRLKPFMRLANSTTIFHKYRTRK